MKAVYTVMCTTDRGRRYWAMTRYAGRYENSPTRATTSTAATHELIYDLQPGTIETCINSQVYNAESEKPKYIHGSDNYDKGTFTVILTNEDNPDITHNKDVVARPVDIRNWQEFVSSEGPFLLKTDKGDVKIVQISSNPVRSYGSGIADIGIVKVTVGWTEVDDISKAVFV